tara:strand:+ start:137 stop:334 length:198 start_codon:yes stop_codon:yes gene_type:complete
MIGIKTFHLFFISISILLTGWYGYFEIVTPTNPGGTSIILSIASLSITLGLLVYGYNVYRKFKSI